MGRDKRLREQRRFWGEHGSRWDDEVKTEVTLPYDMLHGQQLHAYRILQHASEGAILVLEEHYQTSRFELVE